MALRPTLPPLPWALLLAVVVLIAGVTGTAVHAVVVGLGYAPWGALPGSVLVAALYTGVFAVVMGGLYLTLGRRWPLRGPRDAAVHAAGQTAGALGAYALAVGLARVVFHDDMGPVLPAVIANVSLTGALLLGGALYLRAYAVRAAEAEQAAVRAELAALRAQINPHFLFNALNTIAALARVRPAEAEAVTEHLADLFRYSLRASRTPDVPLADEVASARLYLAVETARFGDRLRVAFVAPPSLDAAPVPSLVLQPLVENAVKHGIAPREAGGTVRVEASREGNTLVLRVTGDGPGFPDEPFDRTLARGTGLANVRDRLAARYGPSATLGRVPGGVEVRLPLAIP